MAIKKTLQKLTIATAAGALLLSQAPAAMAVQSNNAESKTSETTPLSVTPGYEGFSADNIENNAPCVNDFTDAPPGASFYESITWMACEGLTNGYSDGSFGKGKPITRGEVAAFLYRYSGDDHNAGNKRDFTDVNPGGSHFEAISWMDEKGYTNGYSDGSYGINKDISRGELAAFIYRFAGDETFKAPAKSPFKDMTPKSSFYEPITWLSSTGIVAGYVDGTFKSSRSVTRGETSKYFYGLETHLHGKPAPPAVQPKPVEPTVGKLYTKTATNIYSSASYSSSKVKALPAQAEMEKLANPSGGMVKVRSGGSVGYVNNYLVSNGKPGTTAKQFTSPKNYAQRAANNIGKWCWGVPVSTTTETSGGLAGYQKSGYGGDNYTVTEYIKLGTTSLDVNHPAAYAIQLHECGHILQYRAYGYDYSALTSAMNKVYPNNGSGITKGNYASGIEHMADCIADSMGAKREADGWITGYGGKCSSAQLTAAKKIIAGQKV